jgi:DNA replication protein DnaC
MNYLQVVQVLVRTPDLLEILDDRYDRRATLVTSQLPVDQWHAFLNDPTLADAILDRLVHNAYRFALKGESMRKQKTAEAKTAALPKGR